MIRFGLFLMFLPGVLGAQTEITVRSGEHDAFSRLVLTIDPETTWELVETRGLIQLVFPEQMLEFEVDKVFDRIPKTRLTAISSMTNETGTTLEMETLCACAASVFAFDGNYLVIDIRDGGPLQAMATKIAPPSAYAYWQPTGLGLSPEQGNTYFFEPPATVGLPRDLTIPEQGIPEDFILPPRTDLSVSSVINNDVTRPDTPPDLEMVARIEQAQDQLLQQLTRAADQGLLDFSSPLTEEPDEIVAPSDNSEPPQEMPQMIDAELLRQLSARTAYDDAAQADLAAIVNAFAKPQCLDDDVFDMANWRGADEFPTQVAALRSMIYGEFDRVAEAEVEKLAKLYLAHGLGVEAISTLTILSEMLQIGPVLNDLAQIVDGKSWSENGPVAKGETCGGDHEMWFLAGSREPMEIIETTSITEAFSQYPIEIRVLIGPNLANAMLDAGKSDAANQILEIIRRAAVSDTAPMQMVSASLLASNDRQNDAVQIFQQVVNAQETESPEAVIALAQVAINQNSGISQSLLTDLAAVAFEQRETLIGEQARLWEIRVNARINGLASALNMVAADIDSASGNPDRLAEVTAEILAETDAAQQGNLAYVQAILEHRQLLSDQEFADPARVQIAGQITALGLPNVALNILKPALARDNPAAKLGAARAHLAQFQPEQALAMLEDQPSDQAIAIALSAHVLTGNKQAIAEILNDPTNAGLIDQATAWRAGIWQNVTGDGANKTMANYMQGAVLPMENQLGQQLNSGEAFLTDLGIAEQPNLQTARDLLAVNRASRAFIESVLQVE